METVTPYAPRRRGSRRRVPVRGLDYQLLEWGDASLVTPERPALVMAHGWMDVGASFQFVVDELERLEGECRYAVAPDWRGFGGTRGGGVDAFWFPDYLGDLDALLDAVAPGQAVDLLGHSMGGNVAMVYAGLRQARVRRLINLEGFGLPSPAPEHSPERLVEWLDELKTPRLLRSYDSLAEVAARLCRNNPRLPADKADWLAPHWSAQGGDGRWHILGDVAHKRVNPVPYRSEEVVAAWRRIAAPMLWIEGAETDLFERWGSRYPRAEFEARFAQVGQSAGSPQTETASTVRVDRVVLPDSGHMLHHDQPGRVVAHLKAFLDRA